MFLIRLSVLCEKVLGVHTSLFTETAVVSVHSYKQTKINFIIDTSKILKLTTRAFDTKKY